MQMSNPIGVFDSGVGGLTVLLELKSFLPKENFIYFADCKNVPYGYKTVPEIQLLSEKIIDFLLDQSCKLIVIACNTVTAAAISYLRLKYDIPIVGLEPAIKPACINSKTGNVGVLATEATFKGNHFINTSSRYKEYINIHKCVAKDLVELAEKGMFEGDEVENSIKEYLKCFSDKNIDFLVLGCTHYPYYNKNIQKYLGQNVDIIDSAIPVARRTKDILLTNKLLCLQNDNPYIKVYATANITNIEKAVKHLFIESINLSVNEIVLK